jgi:capsid protein
VSIQWPATVPVIRRRSAANVGPSNLDKPKGSLFMGRPVSHTRQSTATSGCDPSTARRITLTEARRNSQFFREHLGIFKALIEGTVRHSLGRGLKPTSLCEDTEFAKRIDAYFEERTNTKEFSIREDLTFAQMQKVLLADVITDSDAGVAPVRHPDGSGRLQLFPGASIASAGGPSIYDMPGGIWQEGILRLEGVIPIAYRVIQCGSWGAGTSYRDFANKQFWHIGRTDRINGNRPMPWLHHGNESAINIVNLRELEVACKKLNSYLAATVTTRSGDLPASLDAMINQEGDTTPAAEGETTSQRAERQLAELYGTAGIIPLAAGEEFTFFENSRQSMDTTKFMDYLIADMAVGFGVPAQFVWALTGLAGPLSRMILQQADWFFSDVADMMASDFCQPTWEAVASEAMWLGKVKPPKAGTNWRRVQWQGPGALTIDKGRDGKLFRDMVQSGMGRRSTWHELNGLNGAAENRKAIEEIRELMDLLDEKEVPHHYFFGRDYQLSTAPREPGTGEGEGEGKLDLDELAEQLAELMREREAA